jgi:hypothetical protein
MAAGRSGRAGDDAGSNKFAWAASHGSAARRLSRESEGSKN